jgi:hypothetical protein
MARFGGQVNSRSGAGSFRKNDGRTSRHRGNEIVEFKRTDQRQITFTSSTLTSVANNALVEGREWVLAFELGGKRYVVLAEDDYLSRLRGDAGNNKTVQRLRRPPEVVRRGSQMSLNRDHRPQPVLQRIPKQLRNSTSEIDLQRDRRGNNSSEGVRHRLSGKESVPSVGLGARRGIIRSMGRNLRKGTSTIKTLKTGRET